MSEILVSKLNKPFDIVIDNIASDKSISHRCAIFSLLSDKTSYIKNYLLGQDCIDSLNIASMLGAKIQKNSSSVVITPPTIIKEPNNVLDCGNSGTGMRLYAGLLSGIDGSFVLSGDKYLRSRPMGRITKPLKDIGANVDGEENGNKAPLHIRGGGLKAFKYHSKINSAQIKSALILAALRGDKVSYYKEDLLSRDHTERMLKGMGADISIIDDGWIKIAPLIRPLKPLDITVPADPSSGFFFAIAAAIIPNSKVVLKNMTLNPTRIEAYRVLQKMGAKIEFIQKEDIYEPIGDIIVRHKELNSVCIEDNIAWLIDELPALSIACAVARGTSKIRNVAELRVKESDRISSVVDNLKACGIECVEYKDGYDIKGGVFKKGLIDSFGDHRVAMSFAIAGLLCSMSIKDTDCILTSFPNFQEILKELDDCKTSI